MDSVWTAALNSSKAVQGFGVAGLAKLGISCLYMSNGEMNHKIQYGKKKVQHHKVQIFIC